MPCKRTCNPVDTNSSPSPSPKRRSLSPHEIHVKQETLTNTDDNQCGIQTTRPNDAEDDIEKRKQDLYGEEGILNNNHENTMLDHKDTRQKSIELLMKVFPSYPSRTLELFLQNCRENVVETIECILASQRSYCASGPLDGCTIPAMAAPFLRTANIPREKIPHPGRLFQPLPPPLLLKPKSVDTPHFRIPAPTRPLVPPQLSLRNVSKFCTCCGNKMMMYDQFCSNCGRNASVSPS